MTPCEKLGYKVGDEFLYKPKSKSAIFKYGAKVKLTHDDGSSSPKFEVIDGSKSWDNDSWSFAYVSDMEPINQQEQPTMTNPILRTNGEPFATRANAKGAATRLGIENYEIVKHGDGWAIVEQSGDNAPVTLQPGDYIATAGLTKDDAERVVQSFLNAGCAESTISSEIGTFPRLGWDVRDNTVYSHSEMFFQGRQLTLTQVLNATNAGTTTDEESTPEQERPMPQQHLTDQLEAALAALDDAQKTVERLRDEYRAAYPRIHGEEKPTEDMTDPSNWRAGDVVECVGGIMSYKKGEQVDIESLDSKGRPVMKQDGIKSEGWGPDYFRFVRRA